jgi:hypothetical protein
LFHIHQYLTIKGEERGGSRNPPFRGNAAIDYLVSSYMLVPHDAILGNITLPGLTAAYAFTELPVEKRR